MAGKKFAAAVPLVHTSATGSRDCFASPSAKNAAERSSIRLRSVVPRMLGLLWRGFWRRIWRKYVLWSFSPIALLLVTGLFLVIVALAVGIWAMVASIGPGSATTGTWLLAVTPGLVGTQFLVNALVLDIQATPR